MTPSGILCLQELRISDSISAVLRSTNRAIEGWVVRHECPATFMRFRKAGANQKAGCPREIWTSDKIISAKLLHSWLSIQGTKTSIETMNKGSYYSRGILQRMMLVFYKYSGRIYFILFPSIIWGTCLMTVIWYSSHSEKCYIYTCNPIW